MLHKKHPLLQNLSWENKLSNGRNGWDRDERCVHPFLPHLPPVTQLVLLQAAPVFDAAAAEILITDFVRLARSSRARHRAV